MKKGPLLILTGPTAVGKTALSIGLAKALNGEIISADSMQVYRHMDIGTAKITKEEMQSVPHYLIDEYEPTQGFSVAAFQERCNACIQEIYRKNKLPIIVGGTGFYIQSVLYGVDFNETETDPAYRSTLADFAKTHGNEALHRKLREVDEASALAIHPNNVKRVIRALEYYRQTGQPISAHNAAQREKEAAYDFRYYVLSLPREILYERIDRRVDEMIGRGLVAEVQGLLASGCTRQMVSMQGLGYKQIIAYLCGEDTLEGAVQKIKQETRHFAKRQFTWFQRERSVTWIHKEAFENEEAILAYCVRDFKKLPDKEKEG